MSASGRGDRDTTSPDQPALWSEIADIDAELSGWLPAKRRRDLLTRREEIVEVLGRTVWV